MNKASYYYKKMMFCDDKELINHDYILYFLTNDYIKAYEEKHPTNYN